MKIVNVGYNYRHHDKFIIDRPAGSGDYIMLIFKSDAFMTIGGEYKEVLPNNAIIFRKGTPQYYGARGGEFCNDWIHFELDTDEEVVITELGIPFDTVFPAHNASVITEYIKNMFVERYSGNASRDESLELLFRLILLKLSEAAKGEKKNGERQYYGELFRLKTEIADFPEKKRTIDSICHDLNLSRSYVQHLYREYFGTSLSQEIKECRMEYAKHLLSATKMTVCEISSACGYNYDVHFMRLFKKTVGISPLEYRKSTAVVQNEIEMGKKMPPFTL